jgi:hypothetical protein
LLLVRAFVFNGLKTHGECGMKKLLFIIFTLILFNSKPVHCSEYWAKIYHDDVKNYSDYFCSFQQVYGGGFIVVGNDERNRDIEVMKLDDSGNIIWQKIYAGSGDGRQSTIQQTLDRGYIISTMISSASEDILVLKLDENGNIVWQKSYGTSYHEEPSPEGIIQTFDNGYILSGVTSNDTWALILAIKLDENGNISWQKTYKVSGWDLAWSIQQTKDNGYIIAGRLEQVPNNADFFLLKLNQNGGVSWLKSYRGSGQEFLTSVQQTSDNGYIFGGSTTSFGSGGGDMCLVKVDNNGNVKWQKAYGGKSDEAIYSIQETLDNGFIVTGYTESFGNGGDDIILFKVDESGNIVWQKTYGSNYTEFARSIQLTQDGGYIIGGGFTNYTDFSHYQYLILKLSQDGNIPDCDDFINPSALVVTNMSLTTQNLGAILQLTPALSNNTNISVRDASIITTNFCEESTLIKLSSFTASPQAGKVIVQWTTESETDNSGFNLYRSESENGEYTKINPFLIPAQGSSTQGAFYEFVDNDVQNRKTYYYKLEDIDLNGKSTMHGPVSATPRWFYWIGK